MKLNRAVVAFFIFVLVLVSAPILYFYSVALINGVPLNKEVEPTYVNGLLTASGVFLGFIFAAAISKSEVLGSATFPLILLPSAVFFFSLVFLFGSMIKGRPTVSDLANLEASLFIDFLFALLILERIMKGKSARELEKWE